MITLEQRQDALDAKFERVLGQLGRLEEDALCRAPLTMGTAGPTLSLVNRVRVVRRERSLLFFSDGLSDLHDEAHNGTLPGLSLGYEVGIEVLCPEAQTVPLGRVVGSWAVDVLFSAARWLSEEERDLVRQLEKFRCVTIGALPSDYTEPLVGDSGVIGLLAGIPLLGTDIDKHAYLNIDEELSVGLFPLTLLTPAEYDWAIQGGNDTGVELATRLIDAGTSFRSWLSRPPVMGPAFPDLPPSRSDALR